MVPEIFGVSGAEGLATAREVLRGAQAHEVSFADIAVLNALTKTETALEEEEEALLTTWAMTQTIRQSANSQLL